jgi:hypothetical protein
MITPEALPTLEAEMKSLAAECFGEGAGLTRETELHATDIASGSRNFKPLRDPGKRFAIIKKMLNIIDKPNGIFRVAVRLDVTRIAGSLEIEALALMFLIEKIDAFARGRRTLALLIGDLDNEKAVNPQSGISASTARMARGTNTGARSSTSSIPCTSPIHIIRACCSSRTLISGSCSC